MASDYRLSELGWLQFERVSDLAVQIAGGRGLHWVGRADRGRAAEVQAGERLMVGTLALDGPLTLLTLWTRPGNSLGEQLQMRAADHLGRVMEATGPDRLGPLVVVSNLDEPLVEAAFRAMPDFHGALAGVIGSQRLAQHLDTHAEVRVILPSVLGVRDLEPLIAAETVARSSFDLEAARALARVFWSTAAYDRARQVLDRHRFVVLTGPPEMGKTAIAQMLGLSLLTAGWEVHDCTSPEALWTAHDPARRQLFIADDAFGSTEYRPDAADRWARELGRILVALDDGHRLIWTSRPAPLKAGLERVGRERGAGRFPSPGQVLVDASDLDLAEKTLILFRHAQAHGAAPLVREVVRLWGLPIVEHPYFTPERIRRLLSDRAAELAGLAGVQIPQRVLGIIDRELATPTAAMDTSYRALGDEHRQILIALLDVPAGLVDERELAGAVRRHHPGGLSRPMHELIDRLTDHFLRVTPLGIGWVHPSWRDLVIDELSTEPAARKRFLIAADLDGLLLGLSHSGGSTGERALPLLRTDADWDLISDRLAESAGRLDDRELARLLVALTDTLAHPLEPPPRIEAEALAAQLLELIASHRAANRRPLSPTLIEAWFRLEQVTPRAHSPLELTWTWVEAHPAAPGPHGLEHDQLNQLDDWLTLVEILAEHEPTALKQLGYFDADQQLIPKLIAALQQSADADERQLSEALLIRIQHLAPRHWDAADAALETIDAADTGWWVPTDLAAPPTHELIEDVAAVFTRTDVGRVLADLD